MQARRVRTPTLMIHGENDCLAQAELLYTWLRQGGAEAEFIRYQGEGHTLARPDHVRDRWARTQAWFEKRLGQD
jgi:dipeptidyl aminopeptidase/acylaminoacyl peptidase